MQIRGASSAVLTVERKLKEDNNELVEKVFRIKNMKNNYWQNRAPIVATDEKKWKLLGYEIMMFYRTCKLLKEWGRCNQMKRNLLIESLAIHSRTLVEFFYNDRKKCENDLLAQDLLPDTISWKEIRPGKTDILEEARNKSNKQLAHLSLWRIKIDQDGKKGWDDFEIIKKDITLVIAKFEEISSRQLLKNKSGRALDASI